MKLNITRNPGEEKPTMSTYATSDELDAIGIVSSYNAGDVIHTKDGRRWMYSGRIPTGRTEKPRFIGEWITYDRVVS